MDACSNCGCVSATVRTRKGTSLQPFCVRCTTKVRGKQALKQAVREMKRPRLGPRVHRGG